MKTSYYSILSLFLFLSCQKEIKIDQEKIENKLVLNSIISSQSDTVWVSLTESRDLLYDKYDFPIAKNATIQLFEEGVLVGALTFLNDQYYIAHQVVNGKTYQLEATYKAFKPINAQTKVPFPGILENFTAIKNENQRVNATILMKDNSQEDNFYGLKMYRKEISLDTSYQFGDYYQTYNCTNEFITTYPKPDVSIGNTCAEEFLLKDTPFKNSTYSFKLFSDSYNYGFEDTQTELVLTFNSYNYDYFQYLISKYVYNNNFGNPFAEPVQVYNNIENGYGIFGAVNAVTDTLIIN